MSSVTFGCPHCGRAIELEPGTSRACARCGETVELPDGDLTQCLACGCDEIYRHRDFNQKVGLLIIATGVVLWLWWDNFLPMVAAALIDLVLYLTLPDVGICYRCKAHHRDFDTIHKLPAFDLERHEHYRFKNLKDPKRSD